MRIGAAGRDVTIGAVAGTGTDFGLIIDGTVVGSGVYAGKDATGLQIGCLGGAVDISGGVRVGGATKAISKDDSATATRLGDRKRDVKGKSVSVRVNRGGRR